MHALFLWSTALCQPLTSQRWLASRPWAGRTWLQCSHPRSHWGASKRETRARPAAQKSGTRRKRLRKICGSDEGPGPLLMPNCAQSPSHCCTCSRTLSAASRSFLCKSCACSALDSVSDWSATQWSWASPPDSTGLNSWSKCKTSYSAGQGSCVN